MVQKTCRSLNGLSAAASQPGNLHNGQSTRSLICLSWRPCRSRMHQSVANWLQSLLLDMSHLSLTASPLPIHGGSIFGIFIVPPNQFDTKYSEGIIQAGSAKSYCESDLMCSNRANKRVSLKTFSCHPESFLISNIFDPKLRFETFLSTEQSPPPSVLRGIKGLLVPRYCSTHRPPNQLNLSAFVQPSSDIDTIDMLKSEKYSTLSPLAISGSTYGSMGAWYSTFGESYY